MNEEIQKKIQELSNQRAQILFDLCENDKLFIPEIILGLVHEIRSITKVLKILEKTNGDFKP